MCAGSSLFVSQLGTGLKSSYADYLPLINYPCSWQAPLACYEAKMAIVLLPGEAWLPGGEGVWVFTPLPRASQAGLPVQVGLLPQEAHPIPACRCLRCYHYQKGLALAVGLPLPVAPPAG